MDPKKEDFIKEWIYEGNNDLGLAEFVIKNDGTYYDLVSIRLWRTQHAREQSGVDYDRMKRDEGRFNRNLTTFDYVIIDESLDNMNERGEQIVKDELHAK